MSMASNSKHKTQSRHHPQEAKGNKLNSTSPPTSNQKHYPPNAPAVIHPATESIVQIGSHLEDISEREMKETFIKYNGKPPSRPHLNPQGSGRSRNMIDLADQEPYDRRGSFLQDMSHEPYWQHEKDAGSHPFQTPKSSTSNIRYFGKKDIGSAHSTSSGSTTHTTTTTMANPNADGTKHEGDILPISPTQNMHSLHNLHLKHTEPSRNSESFSQSQNSVSRDSTRLSQTYSDTQTGRCSEESGGYQSINRPSALNTSVDMIPEGDEMMNYNHPSDHSNEETHSAHSGRITTYSRHMNPLSLHKFDSYALTLAVSFSVSICINKALVVIDVLPYSLHNCCPHVQYGR